MSDFNSLVTGTDNLTGLAPSQDPERNRIRSMLEQHPIEQQQQPQPQGDDRDAIRKALDADWKKQRADAEQMVLSTLSEAVKANPDTRAEATKIARQMNVDDIDHVERNMDVMRQMAQQRAVSQMELTRYSPRLAEHLQDLEFARMAHDDVPNLSGWELVQGRWESARTQIELAGLADKMRWGRATPEELARIGVLRVKMKELPQDSNWNPIAAGAYVMGQLWDTMPKAVATGLATGGAYAGMTALAGQAGPQAAVPEELVTVPTGFGVGFVRGFAGSMFLQTADIEGGLAYLDMLDSGYSESAAKWASMGVGVINGMLEVAGERMVAKPILDVLRRDVARSMTQRTLGVALKQFGKDYLIGMGGELSTEVAQELTQIAGEEIARQLSPGSGELQSDFTRGQILPRLAAVAKETFLGMSLVGGLAPTVRFAHDMSLAQQAVATHEYIKALATNADESKLSDRSTPAYAKFIRGASKGRIENFYMDGQTMADMLHQVDKAENGAGSKMLEQAAPEVYAQVAEAALTNGDVVIPSEVFASKLAKTDFGKSLVDHLRANPNAVSFADAKKTIGKREELFAQHAAEVEKEMGATSEFMASAEVVDTAMQRRLAAAGVSKSMAAPQAKFYRNFVVTQAAEMRKNDPSMTPEKFDEENGLRVVKGDVAPAGSVKQTESTPPEFFSALARTVDELPMKAATAQGWQEALKGLAGKGTVKQDEIDWTGLGDWLAMQPGKVSKEQVAEFLRGNGVKVETVQFGGNTTTTEKVHAGWDVRWPNGTVYFTSISRESADRKAAEVGGTVEASPTEVPAEPKFDQYQLPGGTNYREVLLTLPNDWTDAQVLAEARKLAMGEGVDLDTVQHPVVRDSWMKEARKYLSKHAGADGFESSHWPGVPNPIAHLRLNDRTDADGKRVLFVEEIQSDWAQKGRKEGFSGGPEEAAALKASSEKQRTADAELSKALKEEREAKDAIAVEVGFASYDAMIRETSNEPPQVSVEVTREYSDLASKSEALKEARTVLEIAKLAARAADLEAVAARNTSRGRAPSAPFVTKTDAWVALALKKILLLAVEGGYDKVAFVSGEQSVTRYEEALRHEVHRIAWTEDGTVKLDTRTGPVLMQVGKDGIVKSVDSEKLKPSVGKPLDDVVGKDIAEKIASRPSGALSGEGLKVGGEGMKAFYDKIVPLAAEKLLKKLGGGKMGTVETGLGKPVSSFDYWQNVDLQNEDKPTGIYRIIARDADGNQVWDQPDLKMADIRKELGNEVADAIESAAGVDEGAGFKTVALKTPIRAAPDTLRQPGFTITDAMREKIGGGLPLFAPGFRGSFDIGTNTAFLHKSANASTFLHEMSHYYLSMFSRLASQPGATPQMQADWQIILGWFGIKDNAAWLALSEKQRVKFHEQWAYNFEIYLSEGKAPSIELEGPFARFRAWMTRTYKSIRDELNSIYRGEFGVDLPALTPEVRAVMDRMVASEEAIKQYDAVYNPAVFQTEDEYVKNGGTAEDWLTYKAALDAYQQAAIRDLTSMSLGAVRWLGLAQKRADKDFQRERTAAIAETTAAVRAELEASPLYRTESQLRNGEAIDDTGKAVPLKLSKAQVEAVLAKQPELLKRFGKGKTSMLAANGASIDLVARMMGYDSGERMVMELATAPSLDAAVEANVAARMLQDSPEWLDPEYRQARIEQAVHNEARGKFLALQEKVLSRAARPNNLVRNAAKLTAQEILSHKTLREIKPHQFHIAESKSAGQARELLAKGDTAGALMAVRRQILNHELTRAAIDIEREADKVVRSFSRFTAANENLGKTRNVDLIAVARAILAAYGLYKGKANPNDYLDILHRQDPSLYDKLQPLVEEANANAKPYRDLTWEAFQRLRDITDELWNESKASRQIELGDRKVVREEFKAQILAGLARIGVPDKAAGLKSFTATILDTKAILSQVEHWARFMDNEAVGPWSQMVRAIQSGLDTSRSQFVEQLKQMRSILKGLKFSRVEIPAQELGYTFGSESGGHGKAELFGAFLHDGNESNRSKNLIGRGWVPDMENPKNHDGTVDQTKWTAFKQRAIANGTWTEADMDAVQALWDLLDALLPQLQAAHRKMFGYNFDEVAHESFEMFGKKYRGGYVPASPDLNVEVAASRFENLEELQADFKNQMPAVPKNMTKTRTGVYRALFLDARQLIRHVDNVLRLINVQPAISTFLSIIRDPEIAGPLNKIDRSAIESMLLPYLVRVATQRVTMRGKTQLGDSIAGTLKRGAAASIMFLKPANAAQQFAGIINAANFVKPRHLMPGVWQTTRHPIDSTAMIVGKSKYMDLRLKNQIGDLQQDIREMLEKSTTYEEWKAWLAKNTYVLQRLAQNTVDRAVWVGAYNQSIVENGKTMVGEELENRAVADADSAVRLSQGANEAESIAAYRVGTPAYQTFIMFTGYWNTVLNGIVYSNHRMRAFMLLMAFPTVVSGAIMLAAAGGLGDRDDDGDTDAADFTRWILQEQAKAMLAMVPIAGPGVAVFGESMFGRTAQDDRLVNNPAVQVLASAARVFNLVGSKPLSDYSSRDWRDLATMFTTIFQIPVTPITNALGYARDVAIGKVRPQGPLGPQVDYIRGLVTGRASPQSR